MHQDPIVLAHAFGARYDLPIPLLLFVVGGAAVVVVSFLLVLPRAVTAGRSDQGSLPDQAPSTRLQPAWAALSIVVLVLLAARGLAGSDVVADNIVPTTFWLLVWIAVPLSCGLLGDWTRLLNPFARTWPGSPTGRPGLRQAVLGRREPLNWPVRRGWWPAVVLLFALACGELIFDLTAAEPHVIGTGFVLYALVNLFLGLLAGEAWVQRGEVFSVLFSRWGRLGFWRFGAQGRRGFAGGLVVPFERTVSRITFVMLLLISVNFDGLLATPQRSAFERARLGADPSEVQDLRAVSFVLLTAVICLVFGLFALAAVRAAGTGGGVRVALTGLMPSLVPIAFGFLLAHNAAYLLVNSQLMLPLIGNPVGTESWPIHLPYPFNDNYQPNHTFLPSAFYWYLGVVAIVAVHVVAVVLAHRHLACTAGTSGAAGAASTRVWSRWSPTPPSASTSSPSRWCRRSSRRRNRERLSPGRQSPRWRRPRPGEPSRPPVAGRRGAAGRRFSWPLRREPTLRHGPGCCGCIRGSAGFPLGQRTSRLLSDAVVVLAALRLWQRRRPEPAGQLLRTLIRARVTCEGDSRGGRAGGRGRG